MDSLPYRNDAAVIFSRLIRSLPRRSGVLGVATCGFWSILPDSIIKAHHDTTSTMVAGIISGVANLVLNTPGHNALTVTMYPSHSGVKV